MNNQPDRDFVPDVAAFLQDMAATIKEAQETTNPLVYREALALLWKQADRLGFIVVALKLPRKEGDKWLSFLRKRA